MLRGMLAVAVCAAATVAFAPSAHAAADRRELFRVEDPRITEQSGMALSRRHPGVVYTHNDSGDAPQIFALGPDGRTRAVLTLGGATARDWEAMAVGTDGQGRPAIFVGDIGDNLGGAWPHITVYRIPEPANLTSQTIRATAFRFKYADGPRNAETMMIHPETNRLYIGSKLFDGKLYAAPARLSTSGFNRLTPVGSISNMATDGAFAPNGRSYVIRTYFGARVFAWDGDGPGESLGSVALPLQRQGESITYTRDGSAVLVGSEGTNQVIHEVALSDGVRPGPAPRGAPSGPVADPAADPDADEGRRTDLGGTRIGLIVAVAAAAVMGFAVLRRKT